MLFALLAGLVLAFAAPLLYRLLGKYTYIPLAGYPLAVFAYLCSFLPVILAGEKISSEYQWAPSLGINFHFYIDGLSMLFSLLITGFGVLIMCYAGGYLKDHKLLGRFYLYLTLFMIAMLGVVTSGNIFSLFIFWELTSLTSYLLIGFGHDKEESRNSALQALLITGGGGLALMAGLLLLGNIGSSYTISELLVRGHIVTEHPLYLVTLILVLIGAFTKSAQFPFHFWLPNAMAAPTPVSAYLHSATMVKAGVYLLARFTPVLGGTEAWLYTLMIVGGITAVLGALLALQHTDLKAILAYTTISALGTLVMMIGIGTAPALKAMLVFLLAHALYKGTLFLVAGNVDHATGTRDIRSLQGLSKWMMPTAIAAGLASLSMAGVLPFFGFIGKELLYEAVLDSSTIKWVLFAVAFLSGLVFVAVALIIGYRIFWGKKESPESSVHPEKPLLYLPPLILSGAGLLFGLIPGVAATPIIRRSAEAMLGEEQLFKLSLWHGFNVILLLSILTLAMGFMVYRYSNRLQSLATSFNSLYKIGPNSLYFQSIELLLNGATRITSKLQSGYLRIYIAIIVLTLISLLTLSVWSSGLKINTSAWYQNIHDIRLYELIIILLILPALFMLLKTKSRLTSIATLGIIGYSIALFYILFGAPDVAATQLLIETLTVVLFVLILHKLPAFRYISHEHRKYKYIVVSILFGATMTFILLLVKQYPLESSLKEYYGINSYLQGKGKNIVNVILVDFRALDTLGEIIVLAVAAIGIFAMLKLRLKKGGKL